MSTQLKETPRLHPIDKPPGIMMKIAYAVSRRMFGKVLTPYKIIQARKPELLGLSLKLARIESTKLKLDARSRLLIKGYTSLRNGCAFCHDLTLAMAYREKLGPETFRALGDFRRSKAFSPRDLALLNYLDEIQTSKTVTDETFHNLREHFNEELIVEITWLNAVENYYNFMAVPLGMGSDSLAPQA